jgi:hypothetical protein
MLSTQYGATLPSPRRQLLNALLFFPISISFLIILHKWTSTYWLVACTRSCHTTYYLKLHALAREFMVWSRFFFSVRKGVELATPCTLQVILPLQQAKQFDITSMLTPFDLFRTLNSKFFWPVSQFLVGGREIWLPSIFRNYRTRKKIPGCDRARRRATDDTLYWLMIVAWRYSSQVIKKGAISGACWG